MKKFQFNKETGDFEIDPKHLAIGLAEAAKKKHTAIRVTALDYRDEDLAFDATELSHQKWIKSLTLDEDLEAPEGFESLQRLTDLEELTGSEALHLNSLQTLSIEATPAWTDFRQLPVLRKLYVWEVIDGKMAPVTEHPTLQEIYFDQNRKHNSHKEKDLQAALAQRQIA